MPEKINLSKYKRKNVSDVSFIKYLTWYLIENILINSFLPGSFIKTSILKLFGAKIGKNVVIKPYVKIKFPWKLEIGNNSWIGENVWIDNIARVTIGCNTCISQGVYFCTGNHNFNIETFDLDIKEVKVGNSCWIGAKVIIKPGAIIEDQTFIKTGSII